MLKPSNKFQVSNSDAVTCSDNLVDKYEREDTGEEILMSTVFA